MLIKADQPHERATLDVIEAFERDLGFKIPGDYKEFLLKYNGGKPEPSAFPISGMPSNPYGTVHYLFGISDGEDARDIQWNRNVFMGRMSDRLLPIGITPSGDIICASLYGNDAGAIYLWDYYGEEVPPTDHNLYCIAGSFSDFLKNLFAEPLS